MASMNYFLINSKCDVKHMTLPIKTIVSVVKVLTFIITSISTHPIRLAAILVKMSFLNFAIANILYK